MWIAQNENCSYILSVELHFSLMGRKYITSHMNQCNIFEIMLVFDLGKLSIKFLLLSRSYIAKPCSCSCEKCPLAICMWCNNVTVRKPDSNDLFVWFWKLTGLYMATWCNPFIISFVILPNSGNTKLKLLNIGWVLFIHKMSTDFCSVVRT